LGRSILDVQIRVAAACAGAICRRAGAQPWKASSRNRSSISSHSLDAALFDATIAGSGEFSAFLADDIDSITIRRRDPRQGQNGEHQEEHCGGDVRES